MKNIIFSKAFKLCLLFLIIVTALALITKPLRIKGSDKYVKSGDIFLQDTNYLKADLEYRKALFLNSNNDMAKDRQKIAKEAQTDIGKLSNSIKLSSQKSELFKKATAFPKNEKSAVILSRELINLGEYQLAILPAKTATEMDQNYRDAWLYVGIASLKCSELCEISVSAKSYYKNQAKESLNRALRLDPEFEPAKQFLQLAKAS